MMLMSEPQYDQIVDSLHNWVEALKEKGEATKILTRSGGPADASGALTPQRILDEVKGKTPLGQKLVTNWVTLAVDQIINTPV